MKKTTLQPTPSISIRVNCHSDEGRISNSFFRILTPLNDKGFLSYLLFLLTFSFSTLAFAQQASFKGKVFDEYQLPLMDVSVSDGTQTVYTDGDGNFSIEITAGTDVTIQF